MTMRREPTGIVPLGSYTSVNYPRYGPCGAPRIQKRTGLLTRAVHIL